MRLSVIARSIGPAAAVLMATVSLASCGGADVPNVVVLSGSELDPSSAGADVQPVAYLLAGGEGVLFVSAPRYSGSCPPEAEAAQDGDTITLGIDSDQSGVCSADAGQYTFVMSLDSDEAPTRLLVEESGQDDISLNLTDLPG